MEFKTRQIVQSTIPHYEYKSIHIHIYTYVFPCSYMFVTNKHSPPPSPPLLLPIFNLVIKHDIGLDFRDAASYRSCVPFPIPVVFSSSISTPFHHLILHKLIFMILPSIISHLYRIFLFSTFTFSIFNLL